MRKFKVFSVIWACLALGAALGSCDSGGTTTTYTVTFSANGGNGVAPSSIPVNAGSSVALPSGSGLSKSGGYAFGGWSNNNAGTGTVYQPNSSYTPTGDITLFAKWNANAVNYTVTFNINGGNGTAPAAQTAASGSSITLPSGSGLTRTGYTFGGWNTEADGTGTNYNAGSSYTPTAHITLYAVWNANAVANPVANPVANDFTITGTGHFTYDGNAKTVSITPKNGKSQGTITILYNGTMEEPVDAETYIVTFNVAAAVDFGAANGLEAGTITINKANGAAVNAPTLKTKTHNSITIDAASVPGTGQTVEYAQNTTNTTPANNNEWQTNTTFDNLSAGTTYYIFARSAQNTNYNAGAVNGRLTVTTLLTVSPDRIEYYWVDQHDSLVTTSGGATIVAVGGTLAITARGAGYTVRHWYLNGENTGQSGNTYNFSSTAIGKHTVGLFVEKDGKLYNTNITITVTVPYTVTFDSNSGSGMVDAQFVTPGFSLTLPSGAGLTRSGYTFGGWSTDASGTGTNYSAGSSYTPTGNITLYARWYAGGTEANPFVLSAGVWADGIITSSASAVWYSIDNIEVGTTYRVWWNDSKNGNGTKTLDVKVSASGMDFFTDIDYGWTNGQGFIVTAGTSPRKIKVTPYSSGGTGTFSIVYSTGSTRP